MLNGQSTLLSSLITTIRQRGGWENDTFFTDTELTTYIDNSAAELYDLLVNSFTDDYYSASMVITTTTAQAYSLPDDFYKADGLDLQLAVNNLRYTLKRIAWGDRNKYQTQSGSILATHYAIKGDSLYLFPTPSAGLSVTLWYVPRAPKLRTSSTIQILPNMASGESITIGTKKFIGGVDFSVLGSPSDVATALQEAIDTETGIKTSPMYGIVSSSIGDTITLTTSRPYRVDISDASVTFYAPIWHWANALDSINEWEEYIILDCMIKIKSKDESDVQTEAAQKAAIRNRIVTMAANRNQDGALPIADAWRQGRIGWLGLNWNEITWR